MQFDKNAGATTASYVLTLLKWGAWGVMGITGFIGAYFNPSINSSNGGTDYTTSIFFFVVASVFYLIGKGLGVYHDSILVKNQQPEPVPDVAEADERLAELILSPGTPPKSKKKDAIFNLAEKLGSPIYAWSLVNDNWAEQLDSYLNIELEDTKVTQIWFESACAGILFAANKLRRQLTREEYAYFCKMLLKEWLTMFDLINFKYSEAKPGQRREAMLDITRVARKMLADRAGFYYSGNALGCYYEYVCLVAIPPLNQEIIEAYVTAKKDYFEEAISSERDRIEAFKLKYSKPHKERK